MSRLRVDVENFYISYSDMITLLLIFFVYLFSISEIDPLKLAQAVNSVRNEIVKETNPNTSLNAQLVKKLELEQQKLQQMQKDIQHYITENGLQDVVSVQYKDGQLDLNMGDAVLFERGQANLKPQALNVLGKLGNLFRKSDSKIVVEGHTDDIPIQSTVFPSNWELSSARASSVVRYMESFGVKANRFTIIGYNQFKPIAPNNSEANRVKNRRVKITLKPDIDRLLTTVKKQAKH
jgi:chemotaxis protein MotB